MPDGRTGGGGSDAAQRRVLIALLVINAVMFAVEAVAGWIGESTGLLGDAIDMLADAAVYAISLYAVGRSATAKSGAALGSGYVQMGLAGFVLVEVVRRALYGSDPVSGLMMSVGALALAANVTCLKLISRHRKGEVHMRASWVFSRNDVLVNLGVIGGGALVRLTGSRLPDLALGALVSVAVFRGGVRIVRDASAERRGRASG